jgi:MFS family permease
MRLATWRVVVAGPSLRRAVTALALACTADWAFTVALSVVAFRDGGAAAVGLVALARMLPSAFVVPVVMAVADRARRDRVLAAATAIHAVTVGAAAVLLIRDQLPVAMYGLAAVATAAFTVFRPVHSALLPSLCRTTAELTGATVVSGLVASLAALAGPAAAGVLLAVSDAGAVFVGASVLSAGAVIAVLRIRYGAAPRPASSAPRRLGREALEGIVAVARHHDLRVVFGAVLAQTYVRGALNVLIVVISFELLDVGEPGVAALSAAVGAGGIAGSFAGAFLVGSRHMGRWLVAALALWGTPIAVMAAASSPPAALALVAVVGLANAVIDIPFFTLPVRLVPDSVLARAFGVLESLVAVGVAFGSALTPALIATVGIRGALVATGLLLPLVGVAVWGRMNDLDARLAVREDEIAALRTVPMFAVLSVPAVELLADRVRRRRLSGGTVLFGQGDEADSLYVIVNGDVDVIGNGAVIGRAGPGDCVGEIALLRDVPRTATIRARGDLMLLEVDREAFLAAVRAHSESRGAAESLADLRLAAFAPSGPVIEPTESRPFQG